MFKVGDIVKMTDDTNIFCWYTSDIYEITKIYNNTCELYNLDINEFDCELTDMAYLKSALKEYRKMKLENINNVREN